MVNVVGPIAGFLTRRSSRWSSVLVVIGTGAVLLGAIEGASYGQNQLHARGAGAPVARSVPSCFGAASRDPLIPCRNAHLKRAVVPTPSVAQITPNAPCTPGARVGLLHPCAFGVPEDKATATFAALGDSHEEHFRAALQVLADAKGWLGLSIAQTGCPFSRAIKQIPLPSRLECVRWNQELVDWFRVHPEVSTVFVAQKTSSRHVIGPAGRSAFDAKVNGYVRAWNTLPPSVSHIVVIRDTPEIAPTTLACVTHAIRKGIAAGPACAVSRRWALRRDPAAVAAERLGSPRVRLVDLSQFICGRRLCYPVVGGALVYKDTHHLTQVFAATLGPFILRQIDGI